MTKHETHLKTRELILIDNMTYNRYTNGKIYQVIEIATCNNEDS